MKQISICGLLLGMVLGLASFVGAQPLQALAPDTSSTGPEVAFTFDDLPMHGPLPPRMARPEVVKSILATLRRKQMPPVYGFVNAVHLIQFPSQIEILRAWHRAGEPLGSHTWSHPEMDKLSTAEYEVEISRNEPVLESVDPNGDWHWFRYPYLEEGDTLAKRDAVRDYLQAHGYKIAEVSMNFQDYMWNDAYSRCAHAHDKAGIEFLHDSYLDAADHYITGYRALSRTLFGRDIAYVLLLHDGAFDARMLPELIDLYRARGFHFISLPEAEADPAYAINPNIAMPGGGVFLDLIAATRHVAPVPDIALFDEVQAVCQKSTLHLTRYPEHDASRKRTRQRITRRENAVRRPAGNSAGALAATRPRAAL